MEKNKEFSDTRESIERASEASGAREMLAELAKKMSGGSQAGRKIEDFYVKTVDNIPGGVRKIVEALSKYAEKVQQKKMYYSARQQSWFPFEAEDKDKEVGELERIGHTTQRLITWPPKDVNAFNESVKFVYKNMIMGGIEGVAEGTGKYIERDWSHPKPSICDELIAIVTAAGNTGTKTYKKMSCETVGGYELYITTLKRDPIYHHGSDYTIECTEPFRIKGTMTTALRDTRVIEKLKGLHCNILEIHNHDSLSIKSSHIHFKCENMSAEQVKDIMRFLRYY